MEPYSTAFLFVCIKTSLAMSMESQDSPSFALNSPSFDTNSDGYKSFRTFDYISPYRSARRTSTSFNNMEEIRAAAHVLPVKTFNDIDAGSRVNTEKVICVLPDGTCYQNKACRSQYWGANRKLWTECPCGTGYTREPYHCDNYQTKCTERIQDFGCSWILECYLEVDMDEHENYRYEKHGECHVNIGIVIGLVIGVVCILILIVLVILYFKRRKDNYRSSQILSKESTHSFLSSQQSIPLKHGEVRPPEYEGPRRKRSYTPPRGSRHGSIKGTPPPIRRHNNSFSSRTGSITQTTSLHSPLSPISPLPSCDEVHLPLRTNPGEVSV